MFSNKLVSEFLGTVVLLLAYLKYGKPLAFGIALALATYMFGGEFNPVVSLMNNGFQLNKGLLMTILAQVAAAFFAVRAVKMIPF